MRFHVGAIPESPDFVPEAGPWRPLREPSPLALQFVALPFGLVALAAVMQLWRWLTPMADSKSERPLLTLITLVPLIPVHELVHALVHPASGRAKNTILGAWPAKLLFYAHYDGELARDRFIAILALPFLILSVAPPIVCGWLHVAPFWLLLISIVNAMAACGDLLGITLLALQVPRSATVRNQGWRTYWKPAASPEDRPPPRAGHDPALPT